MIAGQPVTYLWRPTIRLGNYVHPATGQRFKVTPERVGKWLTNYRLMASRGHRVYVPVNHSSRTEDNRGWVVDMRQNGEWLEELHQYIGTDAAQQAARSLVSLNIVPNLKDAHGNVYDEAIEHSSLVVNPVILGQQQPAIAASATAGTAAKSETFILSAHGAINMDLTLTEVQVNAIREKLGITGTLTGDDLVNRVGQISASATTCQTQLSASQERANQLQLSATPTLEGFALSAMETAATRAANAAVAVGAISPAVREKLVKRLVKIGDKHNRLALSVSGIDGDVIPLALGVFEDLAENKPVAGGIVTGAQVLPRTVPDSGQNGAEAVANETEADLLNVGKRIAGESNPRRL